VRSTTEYLDLVERDADHWLACSRRGQPLGPAREKYQTALPSNRPADPGGRTRWSARRRGSSMTRWSLGSSVVPSAVGWSRTRCGARRNRCCGISSSRSI